MATPNISFAVMYCDNTDEKPELLKKLLDSVKDQYDELLISSTRIVPTIAILMNELFKKSTGDYIILSGDDEYLVGGTLRLMPDPNAVTVAVANDDLKTLTFTLLCVPRWVYEKIGDFDEGYGAGYEDDDFFARVHHAGIPVKMLSSVHVKHPQGGRTVEMADDWKERRAKSEKHYIEKWGTKPPENWADIFNA